MFIIFVFVIFVLVILLRELDPDVKEVIRELFTVQLLRYILLHVAVVRNKFTLVQLEMSDDLIVELEKTLFAPVKFVIFKLLQIAFVKVTFLMVE